MKLLLDENIAPRLLNSILAFFPGSEHVSTLGLGSVDDRLIWNYARSEGFSIVTKDSDFADLSVLEGSPPKILLLQLGNCKTSEIERLLLAQYEEIQAFLSEDHETCLILERKA